MALLAGLGTDPKLFRPVPARATPATWSQWARSASMPNLCDMDAATAAAAAVKNLPLPAARPGATAAAACEAPAAVEAGADGSGGAATVVAGAVATVEGGSSGSS